jgi:superfamily II DNA/RNA helicase
MLTYAAAGTGKTLGYLLPLLLKCSKSFAKPLAGAAAAPALLVVAPTRELALQASLSSVKALLWRY